MIRTIRASVLTVSALALAVAAATAAPVAYKIDKGHSDVGFKVRHFFSKTPGRFTDFSGTIMLDEKSPTNSSVDVAIQTASIQTNNERRDTHLRSEDFFNAEKFPVITFKSTKVTPVEGNKFKVDGDLTIRDVTKPVTLDAELVGMGAVGMSGTRAGFQASTSVNRKDYGVLWNKTLDNGGTMLDDIVYINLDVEAIKDEPKKEVAKKEDASKDATKKDEKAADKK